MRDLLIAATGYAVVLVDLMALVIILFGTVEAFFRSLYLAFTREDARHPRDVWLGYARWLVAGLTFQLAADIMETSIAPSWDELGKLAAIAIIRTALNYFLEHDLTEVGKRPRRDSIKSET
jgi:uncharacterized membrane protein